MTKVEVDKYYMRQARDFTDLLHDKGYLVEDLELKQIRALEEYLGYLLQSSADSARNIERLLRKHVKKVASNE
jgi:hypothetical protein